MDFQAYTIQKYGEWACIQLKAPDSEARTPIHLCCVIDTSASMSTDSKLENVKRSLQFLLDFLTPQDTISVVTFSQVAHTIVAPTAVTALEKDNIRTRISLINSESNTNISGGLIQAHSLLETDTSNVKQSILLLTDGVANVGLTKPKDIIELVKNTINGFSGTSLSCIGYGTDHNVELLQTMATEGSGSYYVVNNLEDVAVVFGDVLGGLISCFAQQVHIILPAAIEIKSRYAMSSNEVIVGDMSAGMEATILAKIPAGCMAELTGYDLKSHSTFRLTSVVQNNLNEELQINGEAHYLRFTVLDIIEATNTLLKQHGVSKDDIKSHKNKVKECIDTITGHMKSHTHSLWDILLNELNTCINSLDNYNSRNHYEMAGLMTQRAGYLGRMRGIATQDNTQEPMNSTPVMNVFSNTLQRHISEQMSANINTPVGDPIPNSPPMRATSIDIASLPIPPIALTRQVCRTVSDGV